MRRHLLLVPVLCLGVMTMTACTPDEPATAPTIFTTVQPPAAPSGSAAPLPTVSPSNPVPQANGREVAQIYITERGRDLTSVQVTLQANQAYELTESCTGDAERLRWELVPTTDKPAAGVGTLGGTIVCNETGRSVTLGGTGYRFPTSYRGTLSFVGDTPAKTNASLLVSRAG